VGERQIGSVFIDTDVFVIDLRYTRDDKHKKNKSFLDLVRSGSLKGYTSIYNLLEVVGILSFNLSRTDLENFFKGFPSIFNVIVLFLGDSTKRVSFDVPAIFNIMSGKMAFLDALSASVAEEHSAKLDAFVTWNAKHFREKVSLKVITPNV
jgi:hypothetical protein